MPVRPTLNVDRILALLAQGLPQTVIAKRLGVSKGAVHVVAREHKHV